MRPENLLFKISVNRYYYHEIRIILLFLIVVIIVSALTDLFLLLIISGVLSSILLIIEVFLSRGKNQKKFDIITFGMTYMEIGKEIPTRIENINIQKIILHYRFTKGDQAKVRTMTGQENTIKIISTDGETITKNIWCENDSDYWRLKSLGSFLEDKGIDVKMKGFLRDG